MTSIKSAVRVLISIVILSGCGPGDSVPTVAVFNLMSHPILDASVEGIRLGLEERGYHGDRVRIVEVNANGEMDKLSGIALELISGDPDVIVPISTPVTQAVVKDAPPSQWIVFSTVTNPNDVGISEHPANLTGVSDAVDYDANLGLIQEIVPRAKVIGMIYNAGERNSQFGVEETQRYAAARGLELKLLAIANPGEVADAASVLAETVDAFYVGSDNTVVSALAGLLKVASEAKVPVIASDIGSVEQGALAAVSVDYRKLGRRAGQLVADVLDGATPGEIPNEIFAGDSLVLNTKTATADGIDLPASLVARADVVLE